MTVTASDIKQVLFEDRRAVDAVIDERIDRITNITLREASAHILTAGGKRIRPALMLACYKAAGGADIAKAIPVAAGFELIHNWSLVHDDIIDTSETRRGVPTVHMKWDQTAAILAGDLLNNLAYDLVLRSGFEGEAARRALAEMTHASMELIDGELMDVEFETSGDVTEPDYFVMVGKKTGALISASAKVGAILAGCGDAAVRSFEAYGEKIGLAFQIQDDLLDIIGDGREFGKEIGKDIKEGKRTGIVLHALSQGSAQQAARLRHILDGTSNTPAEVEEAVDIMDAAGSIAYAREQLDVLVKEAIAHLADLPVSVYRSALEELAWLIAYRKS